MVASPNRQKPQKKDERDMLSVYYFNMQCSSALLITGIYRIETAYEHEKVELTHKKLNNTSKPGYVYTTTSTANLQ